MPQDPIAKDLDSITLHVTDIGEARTFYTDVMGFQEVLWIEENGMSILGLPGGARLLIHEQEPDEPGRPAGGVTGLLFAVEDAEAAAEEVRARGGDIVDDPWEAPWGPTYVTVADPSGNEFVLIQRPQPLPPAGGSA